MAAIEDLTVAPTQHLHHAADPFGRSGRDQQMKLAVEKYVAMDGHMQRIGRFLERREERLPVTRIDEHEPAVMPTLHHVVGLARDREPRQPSHFNAGRTSCPVTAKDAVCARR